MHRVCIASALAVSLSAAVTQASAEDLTAALSPDELETVSGAVDRGLQWLSSQQNADGSFGGFLRDGERGPAAISTCYATMAFLSRGHQPEEGRYGRQMSRALDWLLSIQRRDGSFSTLPPEALPRGHSRCHEP